MRNLLFFNSFTVVPAGLDKVEAPLSYFCWIELGQLFPTGSVSRYVGETDLATDLRLL